MVEVTLFTSPWCPFSWGAEPQWRRILFEFDGSLSVTYVLRDMSSKWEDLPGFAASWLEAAAKTSQPVDARVLLDDPPDSPVPAHLAVTAVAEQADPGPYLRRLRERIFLERFGADRGDALFAVAKEVAGLNLDRLDIAFRSNGTIEDLAASHSRAEGVELPSLSVAGGEPLDDPASWRDAVLAAGAQARPLPDPETALRHYGTMTTPELVTVCDLPAPRMHAGLWHLATEWRVRAEGVPGGHVWSLA